MNFLYFLSLLALRITALAVPLAYLGPRFLSQFLPRLVLQHQWLVSYAISTAALLLDQMVLYPKYRSPLRHLPLVDELDHGQVLLESPRGATALKWIKQFPDAHIINALAVFLHLEYPIAASPEALRDILVTNAYDFEKPWPARVFLARAIGWGLVVAEGADHRRQRKSLNPAFNVSKIRGMYPLVWEKCGILMDKLRVEASSNEWNGSSGVVEITTWISRMTLDVIGAVAVGHDWSTLEDDNKPLPQAMAKMFRPTFAMAAFFGLHWLFPAWMLESLPIYLNREINETCKVFRDTCKDILRANRSSMKADMTVDESNIIGYIIQSGEFDDSEIIDQMLTFIAAGHETTSNAFSWACYLIGKNPDVQQKLRDEIQSTLGSLDFSRPPSWEVFENQMPYLNGVIEESLRLYPTIPNTSREAIRDTMVAGTRIPAGVEILICPYALNRHPKLWGPRAEEMVPERWIDTDEKGQKRFNKTGGATTNFAITTFLHGVRTCIGKDFAKAELRCAIAAMVGSFGIDLTSPKSEEPRMEGAVTTRPSDGLRLRLTKL